MKSRIFLVFLIFAGCPAYADSLKISVGTSANYLKINDPNYHYVNNSDQFRLSNINLGLSYKIDQKYPFLISAFTNRLLNQETNRQVVSKQTSLSFENRTKITADTLMLGYQINRFIPALFITNAGVDKRLYRDNKQLGGTNQHALLYGTNLTYFYDKAISFSAAILAPNKEFNLKTGIILGINYNFNIL